jgi:Spy/CpxP family protein refolding chaperone
MKRKFQMVAIAVLAVVLCGAASFTYAMEGGGFRHGGMHIYRQLNLTAAQKDQIKTIMQAQRTTTKPLMQQLATNRVAMLQATANGAFNQAQVQSIASQQAQVIAQLAVARATVENQIYTQVLTAPQQAQFNQLRTEQINRINQHLQGSQPSPAATPAQ